jgi:hypothetical protein
MKIKYIFEYFRLIFLVKKKSNYNLISNREVIILSFFNKNISKEIIKSQKLVFEKFGFKIKQFNSNYFTHSVFLDISTKYANKSALIIFFDIDCIPLSKFCITRIIDEIKNDVTLSGAAQSANHLNLSNNLYVGPFFLGVSISLIKNLKKYSFSSSDKGDVAQDFTNLVVKKGFKLNFWFPTSIEEPKWKLYSKNHSEFGLGTTYDNLVYHAFESRYSDCSRFLKKCEEVILN